MRVARRFIALGWIALSLIAVYAVVAPDTNGFGNGLVYAWIVGRGALLTAAVFLCGVVTGWPALRRDAIERRPGNIALVASALLLAVLAMVYGFATS
jgi:hypothetical protein